MTNPDTNLSTTPPPSSRSLAPIQAIKSGLEQMRPQFKLQLPSHIPPERFERVILTAINNEPGLLDADRRSLFNACLKAAQDGLLPDKREGALVVFKDEDSGRKIVQWMPMVFGLIKLIRQSGEIDSVGARIVYQREIDEASPSHPTRKRFEFIIEDGVEKLYHDPMLWGDRGPKVLVYAYARFKNTGYVEYLPMHRDDVMKRKAASRAKKGPWVTWEEEMWLKTPLRALAKRLPLSSEILSRIEREEEPTVFDQMQQGAEQNIAQIAQQFSQGVPPEAEPAVHTEVRDDDEAFVAEFVERAIKVLDPMAPQEEEEGRTQEELDEFATQIRSSIQARTISEDKKRELLGAFNTAVIQKMRRLAKEGKK
jgi:recombination protein RecT